MAETVKAAVMVAPYLITAAEREIKPPGRGEIELQVGYVGICGSDLHAYLGRPSVYDFPIVFGHEFSAKVYRCGAEVENLEEGQWVGLAPLLACGNCPFCASGNNHLCEQRIIFGAKADGAMRERLIVPSEIVYPLPAGVSPQVGTLGEPLAVAVHAVNQCRLNLDGASTIISGAGAIGILIALVVQQRGVNQILLLEIDEKRRQFAQMLGFQVVHPEKAGASSADCLFIATSATEAITALPELLAPHGVGVIVGIIADASINWLNLLFKEASITTSRYFTFQDYQEAIQLISVPGFKAKSLIQEQTAFDELFIDDGQKVMNQARQVMRLLIKL
jgi:2-desacetyl-2-hydroxyethyl bacteriochlorophyllide A dehydrogenase